MKNRLQGNSLKYIYILLFVVVVVVVVDKYKYIYIRGIKKNTKFQHERASLIIYKGIFFTDYVTTSTTKHFNSAPSIGFLV
jgi:hypothetical protein